MIYGVSGKWGAGNAKKFSNYVDEKDLIWVETIRDSRNIER